MYKCKNFKIYELVSPKIYNKYGDRAWQFFDVNLLKAIDECSDAFGTLIVNDWKWNNSKNNFTESGLRSFTFGSIESMSLHKLGKAVDLKSAKYTAEEMRQYIFDNPEKFKHIKAIELGVSWLHIDVRNREPNNGNFFTFLP